MTTLLEDAKRIQGEIESEQDPLRQSLHYREAANLLPRLIKELELIKLWEIDLGPAY